ncbi:MAG: hypothetical protein AB7O57_17455 [Hyphomicrobiaceae bacterium]
MRVNELLTVHLAPNDVIATLSAELEDDLRTQDIEASVRRLEMRIRSAHPMVSRLFIKPQQRAAQPGSV